MRRSAGHFGKHIEPVVPHGWLRAGAGSWQWPRMAGGSRRAGFQCRWQAPGPSGCPQLPQGAGRSLRLVGAALAALKADSFLRRSVLSHCGQCGAGDEWRRSFSNACPQAAHSYSKMGMVSILPKMPKILAVREVAGSQGRQRMLPAFALHADEARRRRPNDSLQYVPERGRLVGTCRQAVREANFNVEFAGQDVPARDLQSHPGGTDSH